MNAYGRVKPATRLAVATIVPLRCAGNTSVWWTIRLLTSDLWYEQVVLPKKARLLLCSTCKTAREQPRSSQAEYVGIEHWESLDDND